MYFVLHVGDLSPLVGCTSSINHDPLTNICLSYYTSLSPQVMFREVLMLIM